MSTICYPVTYCNIATTTETSKDEDSFSGLIDYLFRSPGYTPLAQIVVSFALGLVLGPFSFGGLFFIAYIIIYEALYIAFTGFDSRYWQITTRAGVVLGSLLGFITGRILAGIRDPIR